MATRKPARKAARRPSTRSTRRTRSEDPYEPEAVDLPDGALIPALRQKQIAGPTAQELATHGSAFLTQSLLVQQHADQPDADVTDDVMRTNTLSAVLKAQAGCPATHYQEKSMVRTLLSGKW